MNVLKLSHSLGSKLFVKHYFASCGGTHLFRFNHAATAQVVDKNDHTSVNGEDQLALQQSENCYDIVINGGGIVGFAFLAALKSSPLLSTKRVLLIEQQNPPPLSKSPSSESSNNVRKFSNRVSAITAASKQFFEELDIWHVLKPYAKPVHGMYVWSDHFQNAIHFCPSDDDTICHNLENNLMIKALYERINDNSRDHKNIQIAYGTMVADIEQKIVSDEDFQSVVLKVAKKPTNNDQNGDESKLIRTKLLIGCDGFKSLVRSKSTLPYFEHDLNQMGIVGTLEVESPFTENHVAFQRFISDELVIALLPLDQTHSSLVLSLPKKNVQSWIELSDQDFVNRLNRELAKEIRVKSQLDKLVTSVFNVNPSHIDLFRTKFPPTIKSMIPGSKAAFPLGFGTTVPFLVGTIEPKVSLLKALNKAEMVANTAIIGDAAHRVHPLAGQGLNLGLGDAHTLATCLHQKMAAGYELFGDSVDSRESLSQALYDFERQRIGKLVPMLGAIHSMQTVFSYTPSSLLTLFNTLDWVKSGIVSFANSR